MKSPPLVHMSMTTVYRIIPSRFPPVDLYRDVAPAEDWPLLQSLAMRTNKRLVEESESTGLIRREDRVEKSSSSYILGPLTRPNPKGGRFSDGTFGVLYGGLDFETTQAEVIAERTKFMRATRQKPQRIDMRVVVMDLDADLYDLRREDPRLLDDIGQTQSLARQLRKEGAYGLVFESSARPEGLCVAIFRPPAVKNARQERHLGYVWDGNQFSEVVEYSRRLGEAPGSSVKPRGKTFVSGI